MRYFWSAFRLAWLSESEGFAVHVLDEKTERIYTYSQELKTWHLDLSAMDYFFFPELQEHETLFTEIQREAVYAALPKVARMDRRDDVQRRLSNSYRAQIRKSGQVLTAAEVGLLTKPLKQRPTTMPLLKELLETRSQHKRWTALYLYEEDGPARRKAISAIRQNARLNISSKGQPLEAQHRQKRFHIDGVLQAHIAVEVKYVPAATQVIEERRIDRE